MFSNTLILRPHTQARLTETRQRLLSDHCLYLGSRALRDKVEWLRVGSCDKLIRKPEAVTECQGRGSCPPERDTDPDAVYNQPFELADLAVVGNISGEDFFFTADAGWRPGSMFAPSLEDSRASASLGAPEVALFAADFPEALENIRYLQNVVAPGSTSCRGPFTGPDEAPRIRIRHIFFESVEAPPVVSAETDQRSNSAEAISTSGTSTAAETSNGGAPTASGQSKISVESVSTRDTRDTAGTGSEATAEPGSTAPPVVSGTETAADNTVNTAAVDEPVATLSVNEPAATEAVDEPTATQAVDEPAATQAVNEPAATQATNEPADLPDLEPVLGPEFQIDKWPAYSEEGKAAVKRMATLGTHKVIPLPAYDMHGDLINPHFYRARLQGALVELHFSLTHWRIGGKKESLKVDVFVAELEYLRVLVPPKPTPVTPRKRKVSAVDPTPSPSPSKRARLSSPAGPGLGSPVKKVARK